MLFYTFDVVISAEKTNEHEQKKVYNHIYFFLIKHFFNDQPMRRNRSIEEENIKMFFFFVRLFLTHETAAVRAEMLL